MADLSALKNKSKSKGLGSPPGPDEYATSLNSPEVAPAPDIAEAVKESSLAAGASEQSNQEPYIKRDGRSMRKTNRTIPFATRVSAEFDQRFRDIAYQEDLKIVELLEKALQAYAEKQGYK
ncbi:hypothetical protein NB703_003977 [Pantoea ananatis]|uniref:Stability/partitioning determinant n=1 Tax=Pantoea ananas TaxID=553 RepID=A0AAJ1FSX1_PANAN|nr:hypothetical protein [Pantoea ananatis]MCW0345884.1 hypothetical protein [Pantoea ananatis]PQK94606.1 hypothetical protein CG434_22320 [Pantoea ananatis]